MVMWQQLGAYMVGGPDPSPDLGDPEVLRVVRQVYRGRFRRHVASFGMDQDDAYQDVVLALVRKSRLPGSCWDPARGGLSTWAYVAIQGIVSNLIDQHKRAERRNGSLGFEDAALDRCNGVAFGCTLHTEPVAPPPIRRRRYHQGEGAR